MADFKPSVFILDCPSTELIEQRADHDVIRTCKRVSGAVHAHQTLPCERDCLMQFITVLVSLCEQNTKDWTLCSEGQEDPR